MAQTKAGTYPNQLSPLARADSTKFSTSRVRVAMDSSKATWENIDKMAPILSSIIPARLILYFAMLTTWRRTNYVGAAMMTGNITTIYPAASQPTEWKNVTRIGVAMIGISINTIYPKPE